MINKKSIVFFSSRFLVILFTLFLPTLTFAFPSDCAVRTPPESLCDVFLVFTDLIYSALPLVIGIALLVFFWGLAKFILRAGDEKAREEGKQIMKWGIIALFVLVSVWGIIEFLQGEFGFSNLGIPRLPTREI